MLCMAPIADGSSTSETAEYERDWENRVGLGRVPDSPIYGQWL